MAPFKVHEKKEKEEVERECEGIKEKMYVALGKDETENWHILNWVANNKCGKTICSIHVRQRSNKVRTPSKLMDEVNKEVIAYPHYVGSIVNLYIEGDSIEKGIIQLIEKHNIGQLVMGAAALRPSLREAINAPAADERDRGAGSPASSRWSFDSMDAVREFAASNPSLSSNTESSTNDNVYDQLELAMMDAEDSRRFAFEESMRIRKAEREVLRDAICKVETSNVSLKESEEKLLSAVKISKAYKNKCDKLQLERDNALKEVENLRKQLYQRLSTSHVPPSISVFSKSDLKKATKDYNPRMKIGEGGYGSIYKGFLQHTTEVAIKILSVDSMQGAREFGQEVDVLSKLRHPNLITLVGTCPEEKALVYEYLPGGSLEDRLVCKDNTPPLSWQNRIRIASELRSALIFLHKRLPSRIIHGDLKPANVLLDGDGVCKLSDFGISREVKASVGQTTSVYTNNIRGTMAYIDPETMYTGELTPKSDVYSFGIVLLRLLTGKSALKISKEVGFALDKGTLSSMLDPSAGNWPLVQAEQLARLALKCSDMQKKNRPDLTSDAWRVLETMKASCQRLSTPRVASDDCPISQDIMEDVDIASDGFAYEVKDSKDWLDAVNGGHDDMTVD